MSGGSFNYLFLSDDPGGAYDKGSLHEMAKELERVAPDHPVTAYTQRLVEMLTAEIPEEVEKVWHGMEWHYSADWGKDQLDEVLEQTKELEEPRVTDSPNPLPIVDYDALVETLTHALHSTETAQGWYGAPECAEVGRVLAPHVQALLAQAWAEGWRAYLDRKKLVDDNPYRTSVLPPGGGDTE